MKVLITGASGFVGKNLAIYLVSRGIQIVKVPRYELKDITSESLRGVDIIIHLAGIAHDLSKAYRAKDYYATNYELTKTMYDAFLTSGVKKFIFFSSVKAVADSVLGVLDENVKPEPLTDYGKSKLLAENYIRNTDISAGKTYYILRPCMIHGPGNKGNLNLLYQLVKKGIPYPLGAFKNKRSFLGIDNLCFILNEIIRLETVPSGVYNISDDEALSTADIVKMISISLQKKARIFSLNKNLIYFTAKIGDKLHLPFTTARLNKLTSDYIVSNVKIKKVLNAGLPLSSRDGLLLTFKSFIKNG